MGEIDGSVTFNFNGRHYRALCTEKQVVRVFFWGIDLPETEDNRLIFVVARRALGLPTNPPVVVK